MVEGFDCGNYVYTTEAKSLVISIMTEGRKFKSNCVFRPGCVWSFMYAYYTTLKEAVEVANGLAALDSTCFTNLAQVV
ncbi:hypothetical protein [Chroococcidiopsis sp. SAG 2025]|uniref:hypothetical protein n=1 Tax=Chroococcidiopsis sp. SAG 2025 TaxID=171389 RepID=UPI002936FB2D|nr:hypothetical protein [Chroococcidiopsis sp. SAG 2025]